MTAELIPASNIDRQISRHVKMAIFDSGMTQKAVAMKVGLHPASMSLSMKGTRPWRAEEVLRIAQATGVSVSELLPHLDSNQEPSGLRFSLVRGHDVAAVSGSHDGLRDGCTVTQIRSLRSSRVTYLEDYRNAANG